MILFPVWAGIKKDKLSQKSKQVGNFNYFEQLIHVPSTPAKYKIIKII